MSTSVDKCERCNGESQVVETRHTREHLRRRRRCTNCGFKWATREIRISEVGEDTTLQLPNVDGMTARQLVWLLVGAFGNQPRLTPWHTIVLKRLIRMGGTGVPKQVLAHLNEAFPEVHLHSVSMALSKLHQYRYVERDEMNVHTVTEAGRQFAAINEDVVFLVEGPPPEDPSTPQEPSDA